MNQKSGSESLHTWLETRSELPTLIRYIPYLTVLHLGYALICVKLFEHAGYTGFSKNTATREHLEQSGYWIIPIAAVFEEVVFRLLPLGTIQLHTASLSPQWRMRLLLLTIALSSICFGWVHGNAVNIFIQGVPGIMYSVIYLKYGGYGHSNVGNIGKGLLASSITHATFNAFVITIAYMSELLHPG